jgi:predicted DNA-binding helix-hairpin-helix protein
MRLREKPSRRVAAALPSALALLFLPGVVASRFSRGLRATVTSRMELDRKLEILADAAKYDASCASSGAARKDSRGSKGVGSTGGAGICHSYTPDGRCVSLLKVLLTNRCIYDCHYCINRRSSNVERARFTPEEVVRITLDFYKRNHRHPIA